MSIKLMQRAWDTDLPTTRKMVLLSLADQSNDQGECFPSIGTIMQRCSLSRRAVFDALRELEDERYLDRVLRPGRGTMFQLTDPCTWRTSARGAPVRQAHPCTPRTGAGGAPGGAVGARGGAVGARGGAPRAPRSAPGALPIKQPPTNPHLTPTQSGAGAPDDAGQQEDAIEPPQVGLVFAHVVAGAAVDRSLVASFLDHVGQKPGVVLSIAWCGELARQINALHRDGADVNESIRRTISAGNCTQLLVPKARAGPGRGGGSGGSVTDDYEHVDYR